MPKNFTFESFANVLKINFSNQLKSAYGMQHLKNASVQNIEKTERA